MLNKFDINARRVASNFQEGAQRFSVFFYFSSFLEAEL